MDWKKIGKKLLFPPVWVMAVLTLVCAPLLTYVFVEKLEKTLLACPVYALSFYTLSVLCLYFAMVFPKQYGAIRQKVYANPFGSRYLTDRTFRTKVSLYISLSVNSLYAGINLWLWASGGSNWFMVLAVYYLILSAMRFPLLRYVRGNAPDSDILRQWRLARLCACGLLLINLSLSGAVLMILYQSKGYDYPGILIYVMALYTFYSTIHAAVDLVRYRKLGSPILSTAKTVSLSAALVSMLNLETAMFAQFGGDMAPEHRRLMIILTGAGVSIAVVSLSVMRIVGATKAIRRERHGT